MSHFSVLVIGNDVEEQLAPYEESTENPEYTEFKDITEESLNDYETKSTEKVHMPDGRLLNKWDNEFRVSGKPGETNRKVPDYLPIVEIPFKVLYLTFDEYMRDWCDEERNLDGKYGYYHNPNAKWDWWEEGGRWDGHLITTKGIKTNKALKKDISFMRMRSEHEKLAQERYKLIQNYFKICGYENIPKITMWEELLKNLDEHKKNINELRNQYHSQEPVKLLHQVANKANHLTKEEINRIIFSDLDDYQCSMEEYVNKQGKCGISTFAVLIDGEWHEKGDMGWFGMVANEKDEDNWLDEWFELVTTTNDNQLFTIVDCHI